MKTWKIKKELSDKNQELSIKEIIAILLENRGITSAKDRRAFLHPQLEEITSKQVDIDQKQLKKALLRIEKAMAKKEQIVVFGDYDVDGITGSAILWETLHARGAICVPYIPHRVEEGYGLSEAGIANLTSQVENVSLIITVDNGIVANKAVDFAKSKGIDVIITDHHTPPTGTAETLPNAYAIVHTTKLCGAGVAWVLSKEIKSLYPDKGTNEDNHLELAALGTVADLVPLTGANRTIVTYGLQKLKKTNRVGLRALCNVASINQENIGVYEIGFIIGPRLNAAGRIDSAMDSLRLLCTRSASRADELAARLEITNRERQLLLKETAEHAITGIKSQFSQPDKKMKHLLLVAHESYQEGIIGLVAGKLVEEFYRPSIVIAKGEKFSKASARSIGGFNIIEFLRFHRDHFVNVGGHPMAAGFTIATEKIVLLQETLEKLAGEQLKDEHFIKKIVVDCALPLTSINKPLYTMIQSLAPFGMNNPEPIFVAYQVTIDSMRFLGAEKKHVKFALHQNESQALDAIGFGLADQAANLKPGDKIDIIYTVDENQWNGNVTLQLKVKDFVCSVP